MAEQDRGRGARGGAQGGVVGAGAPDLAAELVKAGDGELAEVVPTEPSTEPQADAEPSTPAQADAEVIAAAETAARGDRRSYRAMTRMGEGDDAVEPGEIFEAYPDDVRVRSGFVTKLKDPTPAAVAEAFDGLGKASS